MAIIKACEEEAAIAGEEFFYSWTVKSKQGPKLVEGLSIGGAVAAARNWGNCALPCKVEEEANHYVFTASFVDFETGFNMQRVFKQRKEQNIGMKDTARAEDITFQIGQSKALRNVILNAMPSWLTSKMLKKAKEEVIGQITKMGIPVAQKKALEFFEQRDIPVERVEKKIGKNHAHWNAEDLAMIKGAMSSLVNGQESADSLFPAIGEEAAVSTNKKTESLKEKIAAKSKAKTTPHLSKAKKAETKPEKPETETPKTEPEDTTEDPKDETPAGSSGLDWLNADFKQQLEKVMLNAQVSKEKMPELMEKELDDLGFSEETPINQDDMDIVLDYFNSEYKLD